MFLVTQVTVGINSRSLAGRAHSMYGAQLRLPALILGELDAEQRVAPTSLLNTLKS